eukprot:4882634-Lingulodinium_polyedra.AAC.1
MYNALAGRGAARSVFNASTTCHRGLRGDEEPPAKMACHCAPPPNPRGRAFMLLPWDARGNG